MGVLLSVYMYYYGCTCIIMVDHIQFYANVQQSTSLVFRNYHAKLPHLQLVCLRGNLDTLCLAVCSIRL